jgi:hypothetical protein
LSSTTLNHFDLNLPRRFVADRVSIVDTMEPGDRRDLARLDGPGCIRYLTVVPRHPRLLDMANRKLILRIYFDGSDVPQVEAPLGDFFGVMHGQPYYDLNSALLSAKAWNGFNCYFPMPFAESARIEFECGVAQNQVYMQCNWQRFPGARLDEPLRFCARWRRENPTTRYNNEYLLFDADGPGKLVGLVYGVRLFDQTDRWSHGGGDNIYIDGQGDEPAYIRGVGGEDTFGVGFGGNLHPVDSHLYQGMPFYTHDDIGEARPAPRVVGYRWFIPDPIDFQESIHLRYGCMANEICSMAYWYQQGAVRPFFRLPDWPLLLPGSELPRGSHDLPLPDHGAWRVCGAFDLRDGAAMRDTLPAEVESPAEGAAYDGGHPAGSPYLNERTRELGRDKPRWHTYPTMHGFVDFNHVFRAAQRGAALTHPAAAVARCTLHAPAAGEATLRLGWDDQLVLRVNGRAFDLGEHAAFRAATVAVPLRAGANDVSVKLSNTRGSNWGGWAFSFRATTGDGRRLLPQSGVQS